MRRIFVVLVLITIFLSSACESVSMIYESTPMKNETGIKWPNSFISRPDYIEEGIRRLAVINQVDVSWSGSRETRTIEINDYISADDFHRINELVLAGGEMDIHGTLYGNLPSYYFGSIQVFLIPSRFWWHGDYWYEDFFSGENYVIGLGLRIGRLYDPLRIHSYTIFRDADSLGNPTDSLNNFTLTVSWADTGITDEQILMQFISYLNEIRRMI